MRRFVLLTVGWLPIVVGIVALGQVAAAPQSTGPAAKGVIYGAVIDQGGEPAKEIGLTAHPLGIALGAALPHTKTDRNGNFRFADIPWWGRYTVFADDENAGYSQFSTGINDPRSTTEVTLSAEQPEAEFNLFLPPKAGFLKIHLTNQKTGELISAMLVTVTSSDDPKGFLFSISCSSTRAILIPPDREVALHITSWGFHEWARSAEEGMPLRMQSGSSLTLDVDLVPSDSAVYQKRVLSKAPLHKRL